MSYQDKIETKLNDLQKEFFRLFRKSFPELVDKIKIEKGIIHPDNFCFSVASVSAVFGKLCFDIDDTEITIFSEFDHSHFPTHINDQEENMQRRIQLTCEIAISHIKNFVSGDVVIEYEQQGEIILKAKQYYKGFQSELLSGITNLIEEKEELKDVSLIYKLKNIFAINKKKRQSIVTKKVNWFGEVN